MKVSWNILPEKLADKILKDVKSAMPKVLEAFSKEVEANARRNFNKAVADISGDNPYVVVSRTISGNKATISCSGEQVLFAEFGAGVQNSYTEKDIYVECRLSINRKNELVFVQGYYRTIGLNAKGFSNYGMTEYMPRPQGIVNLGEYGKGHGKDDYWVRPTTNMRMANGESRVYKRNGEPRTDALWTTGTKPVRALYRARNTAINKLQSGRLKIK